MKIQYQKPFSKVDGSHLVPLLLSWLGLDSEIDTLKELLDDFSEYTADHWFLGWPNVTWSRTPHTEANYDIIIQKMEIAIPLLEQYGKKVVPSLSFGDHVHKQTDLNQWVKDINVGKWIDYLTENMSRFYRICVGSHWTESCFVPFYGGDVDENHSAVDSDAKTLIDTSIAELELFERIIPKIFENKMVALMPIEHALEQESYIYRNNLSDAKVRNFFIKHDIVGFIPGGSFCLYRSIPHYLSIFTYEKLKCGLAQRRNSAPPITRKANSNWPFFHYQNYIKDLHLYSGIGYNFGAENHNLVRLLRFGYKGCYCHFYREQIEDLFTDIKGW